MKASEAVHILKMIQGECGKQHMDSEAEALQMGIQALSAQPDHSGDVNGKVDLIDRQSAIDAIRTKYCPSDFMDDGVIDAFAEIIQDMPSAQPEVTEEAVKEYCRKRCLCIVDSALLKKYASAQPERLTDDDFETIRIHLNAYKEKLCTQQRWEEAEEYQRIIDRFMAFASAQPKEVFEFDKTYPLAGLQVEITKGAYGDDFITIKRPERFLALDGVVYTQDDDRQGWRGEQDG